LKPQNVTYLLKELLGENNIALNTIRIEIEKSKVKAMPITDSGGL
jgi:hypothetical protein